MKIEYAIIVRSKTRLEALIERFNTKAQSKFYIERTGGQFEDYEKEHDQFYRALNSLQKLLGKVIKYKIIDRSFLPSFLFSEQHLILVLGQDGLVANTAKYSNGQPLIAVNPSPDRYDGILLPFDLSNFMTAVMAVFNGRFNAQKVHFAEACLQDGQRLLAFNDLFIGPSSHISARYRIQYGQQEEEQSSSGLIVSTQAGATGWLSSIFNMAYGVTGLFEQELEPKQPHLKAQDLLFAVREPFKSLRTHTSITAGLINQQNSLQIESLMPSHGIIFSDGIEQDFLHFNSGSRVKIGLAKETACLVN